MQLFGELLKINVSLPSECFVKEKTEYYVSVLCININKCIKHLPLVPGRMISGNPSLRVRVTAPLNSVWFSLLKASRSPRNSCRDTISPKKTKKHAHTQRDENSEMFSTFYWNLLWGSTSSVNGICHQYFRQITIIGAWGRVFCAGLSDDVLMDLIPITFIVTAKEKKKEIWNICEQFLQ